MRSGGWVALAVFSAAVTCAPWAAAQDRDGPIGGISRTRESPQNFAFELRFASFSPDVDSDPALTPLTNQPNPSLNGLRPFQAIFGSATTFEVGGEFDWQALRIPHLGTLGPGLGIGYAKFTNNAPFVSSHNGTFTSGETTSLEIFPAYAVAVLRADAVWREFRVPLVPYAKAGLGYSLWRASTTLGTAHADGVTGAGHSYGTHLALGAALSLNPFDEYAAKTFDDSMGVNNTSLFAEWTREDLDGLGIQKHPLRVGGTGWTFGMTFEF